MASNFQQHMGGPGQMMPQRMPQQRPQQGTQASMHIQSAIFSALSSQTGPLSGWQSSVIMNERITLIFNIIGNLRLASQHQPNAPPLQKMVEIGIKFEKEIFEKCASKEQYKHEVEVKLQQLLERRNQQQANLQHTIQQQAQVQAQQAQAQAQQMMMNQNIQGQGMAMPQQPGQQSFAHLQHQMQVSPLPGQQSQQNVMGMQNQGLPQNSAQNQQQQQFMAMQQQQQQNQSQNVPGRPGGNQPSLSQQENALVSDWTNRLMAQTSEEDKNNLRARLRTQMEPASYQKCQAQGMDPIILYFRQQAISRLRAERSARAQQLQLQQGQNMPTATPMQQQRSMQPSPAQAAAAMGGNVDFSSFMGNMETLAAQQQQAGVMAEQSGQTVVPASSGAPRNPTPQPGVMPGQGMNDQRGVANPNPRAQQQQQMFNAQQQLNHQRLQHAQAQQQQQQSQAAARLNAQKNAQQIALNGQPGGMGPGPVPQQSPAMATLNAPMRTPSQQNSHPELPQANSNAPFGQPIDPRFTQGNQRQPGQANGMNAAMFAMGQSLPPEKLNDVVNKWNNNNGSGGRPGMPMQGNPQGRPGMPVQQPGQMNAQNQAAQFAMANPGQRPPPNMMGAMNPQQQLILQQQMAALRPGQMQQRNLPVNVMQMEQRNMLQMDTADIPPIFLTQQGMPQGFPPDIKKWGQMKQWVLQNPNLGPNALEGVRNFQRLHFQQLMQRSRQQQQGQPGGMPPNQAGMPGGMQSGGPGMAAPVAPMGPNPMMTQGMPVPQLRQPTPQEIQTIRSHPSGKLANATDDQIRSIFMTNQAKAQAQAQAQAQGVQMNPQQQEQQRRLLALQQMKQVQIQQQQQQNNGQQPQPGQAPQPNMTGLQNQAKPISTPQSKPGPASKPASSNTPNQAARPLPNARNAAQNPSPAQPVKNLKRQNSDDVVEVPNPNTQQQQPNPQQVSNIPQMRKLNPQQVAALAPEMRKKYEAMLRMNQMNQVNGQNTASPMDQMKLKEISKQEEQDSQHNLQDIPMDTEMKQKMRKMLESIVSPLANVTRVLFKWFSLTLDEDQARKFYRARYRLAKQFQDPQMTRPKENFSIWPQEVEAARALLGNMVKDLSAKYPDLKKPNANKAQGSSQGLPQPSQNAQPQTPLNAANLQQQQQQINKQLAHQRSNSRSSHTPAAPTSTQPPFQLGATSPHGAPVYAKNTLDVDKLHIPARKKQKQAPAPGQGTPGSNSSPHVAKAVSPEMKRQQQPEMKAQKPALCCKEPDCERHQVGFESEEDLRKHTQEEHIGPLENPDKFVQDILATSLGLDAQGQPKKPAPAIPEQAPKMATSNSKQGQTPNIKAGNTPSAATPMMRQASMNRQASATGAKPNAPSKGTPAKEAATKAPEQKDVKKESQTPASLESNDAWADAMIDPTELFTVFQQFETGAGGSISDMNVFRGITPNDTPESSKDGVSEPNSDISDGVALDINMDIFDSSWQPFGPSDTEGLGDFTISNDEDLMMFDEERPLGYPNFDDVDTSMFDKPFSLDTKLFSLDSS